MKLLSVFIDAFVFSLCHRIAYRPLRIEGGCSFFEAIDTVLMKMLDFLMEITKYERIKRERGVE